MKNSHQLGSGSSGGDSDMSRGHRVRIVLICLGFILPGVTAGIKLVNEQKQREKKMFEGINQGSIDPTEIILLPPADTPEGKEAQAEILKQMWENNAKSVVTTGGTSD